MNMVDDAQGTTLSWLAEEETSFAAMQLLWQWIDRYGIPQSLSISVLVGLKSTQGSVLI